MPEPGGDWDQFAREVGMTSVDEIVAAAARQPGGTLLLRSDRLTPAELADEVLAAAGLSRVHADGKPMRQARPHGSKRYLGCVAHQAGPIRRASSGARHG